MSEQENAAPGLAEYPVRASIDCTAKGQLTPKFSFAYRTNAEMIANLGSDYRKAFRAFLDAAKDCGQDIAGDPLPLGWEA